MPVPAPQQITIVFHLHRIPQAPVSSMAVVAPEASQPNPKPTSYDTPDAEEEEEVEIEIRGVTPSSAGHPPSPSKGNNRDGVSKFLRFPVMSTALEMEGDNPDTPETQTFKSRMRALLHLPNSAIKQTWEKLDISEDGICEQEEYGDCREGWFWKGVHDVLFGSNTIQGQIGGVVLLVMITTSVTLAVMDSVHWIRSDYGDIIYGFEVLFTAIFSIEYVLRVACLRNPREYICSAMGIVDISSIVPTFITFFLPPARPLADLATLRIFRVIRVFRVLRLVRFVDAASALSENINSNKMRVAVFMFFVFSMIIVIGCTMYLIEGEANGFSNIPVSLYWAVVTLTTVGYGDIAPLTVPGRLLAAVVMFSGYGVIACPLVLNTQTEEEALRLNCECVRCFRGLHQQDANFCRHCGTALRVKTKKIKKKSTRIANSTELTDIAKIEDTEASRTGSRLSSRTKEQMPEVKNEEHRIPTGAETSL